MILLLELILLWLLHLAFIKLSLRLVLSKCIPEEFLSLIWTNWCRQFSDDYGFLFFPWRLSCDQVWRAYDVTVCFLYHNDVSIIYIERDTNTYAEIYRYVYFQMQLVFWRVEWCYHYTVYLSLKFCLWLKLLELIVTNLSP